MSEHNTEEGGAEGIGNALKAIRATDDELVVGNYIVLFGGRDLEGVLSDKVNADGSKGEFFTKATQFDSAYTSTGALYVDWAHGVDPDQFEKDDSARAPGRDEVLGVVDWKTAQVDDKGVWVERVLSRRNAYIQHLEALITDGLVGNSSEAVSNEVEIKDTGEIARWPLKRDALTVTPMEPRMLTENSLAALKALAEQFPSVKSLADATAGLQAGAQESAGKAPSPAATAPATVNVNINIHGDAEATQTDDSTVSVAHQKPTEKATNTEDITMSEKENVQTEVPEAPVVDVAAIAKAAAEEAAKAAVDATNKAWQDRLDKEPATNKAGIVTNVKDEADRALEGNPFEFGKAMQAIVMATQGVMDKRLLPAKSRDGYDLATLMGNAFVGSLVGAKNAHKSITGLGGRVSSDGGFLTDTLRQPGIMGRVYEVGNLLSRVSMVGLSGDNNSMVFNAEDETSRADGSRRGGVRGYWVAEGGSITSSAPTFRQVQLNLRKVAALVYATDELLADASALESHLMNIVPEELTFMVEDAIIDGAGAGQPQGIKQSGAIAQVAKETGQAADTIVAENVIKMWARMWAPSRRNAIWLYNQDCEPQLMTMSLNVGTGGVPLYMPPGGLSASPYSTLLGRPAFAHESCDVVGTEGDLLLIDPSAYQMIEKGGVQSASSIHVSFTTDQTVFRFTYRCDGKSMYASPLTPKSAGDTVSPFVTLASRD